MAITATKESRVVVTIEGDEREHLTSALKKLNSNIGFQRPQLEAKEQEALTELEKAINTK